MSEDGIKADPNTIPGPAEPNAGAGPAGQLEGSLPEPEVRPDELPAGEDGLFAAPPAESPKQGEEPESPPTAWLELARSAGPPAHWLALFESETPAQSLMPAPEDEPPPLSETPDEPAQPPEVGGRSDPASEEPTKPALPRVLPGQPLETSVPVTPPRLRLRPTSPPEAPSPDQKKAGRGEISASGKESLQKRFLPAPAPGSASPAGEGEQPVAESPQPEHPRTEPDAGKAGSLRLRHPAGSDAPESAQPPASPVRRVHLRWTSPPGQPAETSRAPASAEQSAQTPSLPVHRQELPGRPVEHEAEGSKARGPAVPGPAGQPNKPPGAPAVSVPTGAFQEASGQRRERQPGPSGALDPPIHVPKATFTPSVIDFPSPNDGADRSTAIPTAAAPSFPGYPAPTFPPPRLTQPSAEPRWSQPSTAHWPDLPDPLPPARLPERPGNSWQTLRPDHRLRLNQEQKGKSWNA